MIHHNHYWKHKDEGLEPEYQNIAVWEDYWRSCNAPQIWYEEHHGPEEDGSPKCFFCMIIRIRFVFFLLNMKSRGDGRFDLLL